MASSTIKTTTSTPIAITSAMCNSKVTPTDGYYVKSGRICNLNVVLTSTQSIGAGSALIITPPNGFVACEVVNFFIRYNQDFHPATISTTGQLISKDAIPSGATIVVNISYASAS